MTTVVYRDSVLASDSMLGSNGAGIGSVKKIWKLKNGNLVGACGTAQGSEKFISYMNGDISKPESIPALDAILIDTELKVYFCEDNLQTYEVQAPFFAVGSGSKFALGAMEMGASAEEAVRVAMKYDISSGGEVQVLKLEKETSK
jgi:20S proteasome alpha/beta subunit